MNEHKLRILWNSNALFSMSGYGQQTAELVPLIANEGYQIANSNFYGQQGGKFVLAGLENVIQYPNMNHTYGSDALVFHGKDFQADIVISLQDIHSLNPQDLQNVGRWIPWVPVDTDPINIMTYDKLPYAYRVISMSRFGQKQMEDKGIASTYIPHSVNTDIFKPLNKNEVRQKLNIPQDIYLVGMVGANKENPARKSFQESMDAFKMFLQKVPNAFLYIHTFADFPGGFPILHYAQSIGIRERIVVPDPYKMNFNTSKHDMAEIYNTFDVFLGPSKSEGFQIPVIEAQACGIPVIVNDFTAPPELIRNHITGYKTKVAYRWFSPSFSYWGMPDVEDIYNGLVWAHSIDKKNTQKRCTDWIENNFSTKYVFENMWKAFLQRVENEIYGQPQKPLLDKTRILVAK